MIGSPVVKKTLIGTFSLENVLGLILGKVRLTLKLIHDIETLCWPLLIEQLHLVLLMLLLGGPQLVFHGEWLEELQDEGVVHDEALDLLHQVLVDPEVVVEQDHCVV